VIANDGLQLGGIISIYGMTTSPTMPFQMGAVLKNIEVRGSTMGSRKEFADMVKFVNEKNLKPVVSRYVSGGLNNLEGIDSLFEDMKAGKQFGKLVIEVAKEQDAKL
jgi:D-arabinose 1-dehydrogenase-like Zn-dependent alcohol dehydrogenase